MDSATTHIETEKQRVPAIRFKEFDGDWSKILMEKIYPFIRNGFVGTATPYYIENGVKYLQGKNVKGNRIKDDGMIYINDFFHNKNKKSQLKLNDIVMVQSGHVGECAVITASYVNANCHALLVLSPTEEVNSFFYSYFYYTPYGLREIYKIRTGNTIAHVLSSDVKKIEVPFPTLPEQQKIASFLSAVDDKVQQLTKKKELLEHYKKGVMQQLFSGKLRFKAEDGNDYPDWEEKQLGDVAAFLKGKGISKADLSDEGVLECIRYGELYTVYGETIIEVFSRTNVPEKDLVMSEKGDVIIPASGETQIDIATASCVLKANIALGGDLNIIRSANDGVFLAYYLNSALKFDIARLSQGISVVHLYSSQLKTLNIAIPVIEEQQKIATYLSGIDTKIESVNTQITQTQTFKKGLLQQMFV
jgi:type I restriction enzyme S subunit